MNLLEAFRTIADKHQSVPNILLEMTPFPEGIVIRFRSLEPRGGARSIVSWETLERQPEGLVWMYDSTLDNLQRILEGEAKRI